LAGDNIDHKSLPYTFLVWNPTPFVGSAKSNPQLLYHPQKPNTKVQSTLPFQPLSYRNSTLNSVFSFIVECHLVEQSNHTKILQISNTAAANKNTLTCKVVSVKRSDSSWSAIKRHHVNCMYRIDR